MRRLRWSAGGAEYQVALDSFVRFFFLCSALICLPHRMTAIVMNIMKNPIAASVAPAHKIREVVTETSNPTIAKKNPVI